MSGIARRAALWHLRSSGSGRRQRSRWSGSLQTRDSFFLLPGGSYSDGLGLMLLDATRHAGIATSRSVSGEGRLVDRGLRL